MGPDITFVETAWGDSDAEIAIRRDSEEFLSAAHALSDFISALNLPADKNNQLVGLIIAQVGAAEENAFRQGLVLGRGYGRYEAAEKTEGD